MHSYRNPAVDSDYEEHDRDSNGKCCIHRLRIIEAHCGHAEHSPISVQLGTFSFRLSSLVLHVNNLYGKCLQLIAECYYTLIQFAVLQLCGKMLGFVGVLLIEFSLQARRRPTLVILNSDKPVLIVIN